MIDEAIIKAVTEIANTRIRREYPLLDKHFGVYEVGVVCEAYDDLSKKMVEEKGEVSLHLPHLR